MTNQDQQYANEIRQTIIEALWFRRDNAKQQYAQAIKYNTNVKDYWKSELQQAQRAWDAMVHSRVSVIA